MKDSQILTNIPCGFYAEGKFTQWHKNGQKWLESFTKNGQLEGIWTEWYENGQKQIEGSFKNHNMVCIWREWDKNGNLIEEKDFSTHKNNKPSITSRLREDF